MVIDIERIINLARINLDSDEKPYFIDQMKSIIQWVEKINSISEEELKPEIPATPLRVDEVETNFFEKKEVLRNAPEVDEDFFIVSRVINKR